MGFVFGAEGFTAIETQPRSFEPVPQGRYNVRIVSADEYSSDTGKGGFNLRLEITDEKYEGRLLFDRFILVGNTEKGIEFVKRRLSELLNAVDIQTLHNTDELVDRYLEVYVTLKQDEGYKPQNRIAAFYPIGKVSNASNNQPTRQASDAFDW